MAHAADDGSLSFQRGISKLENLVASIHPEQTVLLGNYPNLFNPETWIPYHIAAAADVSSTIYDTKGAVVRHAELKREISCQKNGDPPAGAPHYYKSYTSAYDSLKRRLYTMEQVTVTGRENARIERKK